MVSLRYLSFFKWGCGIAAPVGKLSKGERLRKGRGGIVPNRSSCWDTKNPIHAIGRCRWDSLSRAQKRSPKPKQSHKQHQIILGHLTWPWTLEMFFVCSCFVFLFQSPFSLSLNLSLSLSLYLSLTLFLSLSLFFSFFFACFLYYCFLRFFIFLALFLCFCVMKRTSSNH